MAGGDSLEITWYGHAMFTLSGGGVIVACDPVPPDVGYRYDPVSADLVLVSHGHFDHNYLAGVKGSPKVVETGGASSFNGLEIEGIEGYHDGKGGKERGENIIFTWEQAGLKVAHLGDLGEMPGEGTVGALKGTDIMMMPVGGVFTIDGKQAARLAGELAPAVVIPMHYKTADCSIPVGPLDDFTDNFGGEVRRIPDRPVTVTRDALPSSTEVWIVPYR